MTSASGTSYQCSAAADGNSLHIVWEETRDGNYEIYTKSSDDGGDTWSADTRLTNQAAESRTPTVGVGGGNVHVAWTDARAGNFELHYLRSLDNGLNWDEPVRLTNNYAHSDISSIAVLDNKVHIAWYDARYGDDEILYKRSEDFGTSWTADINISQNASDYSRWPSLAVTGDEVHVVWERWYGSYNVFYRRSTNGGVSWEPVVNLSGNNGDSWYASVATIGLGVHVVWMDTHHGNKEIYYKRQSPDYADLEWNPTDSNQSDRDVLTANNPLSLEVFPNPSQDDFSIFWRSKTPVLDGARVEIYDATGRIVYETSLLRGNSGLLTWDRRDQNGMASVSGVYLVRFQTNNVMVSQRVISIR